MVLLTIYYMRITSPQLIRFVKMRLVCASAASFQEDRLRQIHKAFKPLGGALLLALLALPSAALAQQGKVSGTVLDPHQATVVGVKVTVTNLATKKTYAVKTDEQGAYSVSDLPAGEYTVSIDAPGFKPAKSAPIKVAADGAVLQNLSLTLGNRIEQVEVHEHALNADLKSQTAALITSPEAVKENAIEFTAQDIENLSPNNLIDVLMTVPGFDSSYQGRQHADTLSFRGGNFSVIIDGVYLSQLDRVFTSLPVDMIESMTIVRNATSLSLGPLISFNQYAFGTSGSGIGSQGFLLIRTKRARGFQVSTLARGGNWGTAQGGATIGYTAGPWDFRINYNYNTSAGRDNWNTGYRNGSVNFHSGYTSKKLNWEFMYYGSRGFRSLQYDNTSYPKLNVTDPNNLYWDWTTAYNSQASTGMFNINYQNLDLYTSNTTMKWNEHNRTELLYGYELYRVSTASNRAPNDNTQGSVDLKHTLQFKGNNLTGGGSFIKYIAPFGSAPNNTPQYRVDEALYSWYVTDEFNTLHNRLTLDGGIRSDKVHDGWSTTLNKKIDVWNAPYYTASFGALYRLTPKVDVSARYGFLSSPWPSSYILPTGGTNTYTAVGQSQKRSELNTTARVNPHLTAVFSGYTYLNTNAAATPSSSTASTIGSCSYNGTTYYDSYDTGNGVLYCRYPSPGVSITYGGDISLSGRAFGPFRYAAAYGYMSNTYTAESSLSRHTASGQLTYRRKQFFANFNGNFRGSKWSSLSTTLLTTSGVTISKYLTSYPSANIPSLDGIYPLFRTGGFALYNLNAGMDFKLFKQAMTMTGIVSNLTNNQYVVNSIDPNQGRMFAIQLTTKLAQAAKK